MPPNDIDRSFTPYMDEPIVDVSGASSALPGQAPGDDQLAPREAKRDE
jgi:hypothetical protein